jgi:disulfide bond formation protein DsbB
MTTKRTAASGRAFGKPVLAGLLVLLLFVSALASASHSLHHWLHQDHQTPSHYCLVTVLEHGHTDVVSVWMAVVPAPTGIPVAALPNESFFISHDLMLHPERGPPVLS